MFNIFNRITTKPTKRAKSKFTRSGTKPVKASTLLLEKQTKVIAQIEQRQTSKVSPKPRATLGETVRALKAAKMPIRPAAAAVKLSQPRGASFRTLAHSSAQGERAYKLYLPSTYRREDETAAPLPLLVMLHGCAQTPDDFAAGTRMNSLAEEFGFIVAYPAQPRGENSNRCWNWYKRGDQGRDQGEPALIAGIVTEILRLHRVDQARVYVAGLSAGGSAAAILATTYPDLFAAIGIHSGLPAGAAHDATSGLFAMRNGAPGNRPLVPVPTIVFHGDADLIVNPSNGRYAAARAIAPFPPLRKTMKRQRAPGGRYFVRTVYRGENGKICAEHWVVEGAGHAWSGGSAAGSYSDPMGPDASRAMIRFFLKYRTTIRRRASGDRPI